MFLALGVVGVVLFVMLLVFDDFLDGILPDSEWISGPIIAGFLAAFGLIGWGVNSELEAPTWLASLTGIAGGVAFGYGTFRFTRALNEMPTDATPRPQDFVGREGRIVTTVETDRVGEVMIHISGQPVKLTAVADERIERGDPVVVVQSVSATKVIVQPSTRFWGQTADP